MNTLTNYYKLTAKDHIEYTFGKPYASQSALKTLEQIHNSKTEDRFKIQQFKFAADAIKERYEMKLAAAPRLCRFWNWISSWFIKTEHAKITEVYRSIVNRARVSGDVRPSPAKSTGSSLKLPNQADYLGELLDANPALRGGAIERLYQHEKGLKSKPTTQLSTGTIPSSTKAGE